jgi:hypothetical protein
MRYLAAVALVVLGMVGLYNNIEYSGWVVAVGLIMAI